MINRLNNYFDSVYSVDLRQKIVPSIFCISTIHGGHALRGSLLDKYKNMQRTYLLIPLILLVFVPESFACSFAPMTEAFVVVEGEGPPPEKPDFIVKEIKRGHDDGNAASCSDAGILVLKRQSEPHPATGYIFEIAEGEFEDGIFSPAPIKAVERNEKDGLYNFVWLDGESDWQEPIDIMIKIVAVSKSGQKSEPQMLEVTHPGTERPWWRVW